MRWLGIAGVSLRTDVRRIHVVRRFRVGTTEFHPEIIKEIDCTRKISVVSTSTIYIEEIYVSLKLSYTHLCMEK